MYLTKHYRPKLPRNRYGETTKNRSKSQTSSYSLMDIDELLGIDPTAIVDPAIIVLDNEDELIS